jgi:hypothetical protein
MARDMLEPGAFDEVAKAVGLKADQARAQDETNLARSVGLHEGGEYRVLGTFTKGTGDKQVRVKIEQNTSPMVGAPEPFTDVPVVHQPVAIVEGPLGTVCVDMDDHDAQENLERAHQAVTDPNFQREAQ